MDSTKTYDTYNSSNCSKFVKFSNFIEYLRGVNKKGKVNKSGRVVLLKKIHEASVIAIVWSNSKRRVGTSAFC
jgi:hypothetical protein